MHLPLLLELLRLQLEECDELDEEEDDDDEDDDELEEDEDEEDLLRLRFRFLFSRPEKTREYINTPILSKQFNSSFDLFQNC